MNRKRLALAAAVIVTVVMALSCATAAFAAENAAGANGQQADLLDNAGGQCGDNVFWTFDASTGVLSITGTGPMTNYTTGTEAPWIVSISRNSVKSVTISEGVTSIGDYAFDACSSLSSATIPSTVTSIGEQAFEYCKSLTYISIPEGVTSIGGGAFSNCSSLASVAISEGVTSIGDSAFSYCTSLSSITIPSTVTSIGGWTFAKCRSLSSVAIPEGVTSIGEMTFNWCTSLSSITIPSTVTSIGEDTFHGCTSLTSISIPGSVTTIGNSAFKNCSSLTSVTMLNGVTAINNLAFAYCTSLQSVYIPSSMKSIGKGAFYSCYALKTLRFEGTELDRDSITISSDNDSLVNAQWIYNVPFPDAQEDAWYYDVMVRVVNLGLIEGYDNGTFGPNNTLSRAQAATILWRYYDPEAAKTYDSVKNTTKNETGMSDVEDAAWYTGAANWAVANGVISGRDQANGSKLFDPDGVITREQLCAIVANASAKFASANVDGADKAKFAAMPDAASVDGWAANSVAWSLNNGVISGKETGSSRVIDPLGAVTRAEMAAVTMNALDANLLG